MTPMTTGLWMFRRHRPAAVLVVLVVTAVAMAGCTGREESRSPSPTASPTATATASVTPTPDTVSVPGGEKPPTVFDDDCERMISPTAVADVIGFPVTVRNEGTATAVANLGGLGCTWEGEGGIIRAAAMPQAALGETEFPADQIPYYFEECDPGWVCGWRGEGERLWTAVSFQLWSGMTREAVDAWGQEIGAAITAAFGVTAYPSWEREDAEWWPVLDCARVAERLSTELGTSVTGEAGGYHDPPAPEVLLAAEASHESQCYLTFGPQQPPVEVLTAGGQAWAVPFFESDQPYDVGVDGITAYGNSGYDSIDSSAYSLTDGVNAATVYLRTQDELPSDEILRGLAVIAAEGWR
ncbi:hypothetical protein [Microbacterium invictum]|uniref:DUF3558 domain-containing protein n=1 Tax=Microbacterium invictum TaxID=515415 RepID=A0ABZ0VD58_9MICO|nr:hypothetical protein [Microbacterium invictum]WQB70833.1 hypothetical protein T9R20_02425 [Microbacterium invictum]